MTIRVALHHKTSYRYDRSITLGPQAVRLRPAPHARTPIPAYNLDIQPRDHFINWQQDPFANPIARLVFQKPTRTFEVTVDLIADMTVINPFDFFISEAFEQWPFDYSPELRGQLQPYLTPLSPTPTMSDWLATLPTESMRTIDYLVAVNQLAQQRVEYRIRLEPGTQTPTDTLQLASGSCRDSAWMMVDTFRHVGLASRFVSGYLIQLSADEKPIDGPAGPAEDFCDLHAWTEVYLPGAGWVGLDPTSGLFAGEGHIPLACTPTFDAAAPITGGHDRCEVEFEHEMSIKRVHEDPRVTMPLTDDQWTEIQAAGRRVDEILREQDVRLTMGGEPTFVSVDNMDDPQWNTEAVGEEKRVLSNVLLQRLKDRFGVGPLLHYGQGKWYPGESLPRWALTCLWRKDGEPIWQNQRYLADEGRDDGHTHDDAKRFTTQLAEGLGVSVKATFPVHEDVFHYLWRENRLPVDVDPTDPKLDDPNERAMMIRAFTRGLSQPVGYVLPLRRAWWQAEATKSRHGWQSGRWPVRQEPIYLIPGDSPIGLRLPLDQIPADSVLTATYHSAPYDPTAIGSPLPPATKIEPGMQRRAEPTESARGSESAFPVQEQVLQKAPVPSPHPAAKGEAERDESDEEKGDNSVSGEAISTALCVEARHGRLHVFMPPVARLDDYLDLIEAIEATCVELDMPVVIEGYLPPPDHRVEMFKVTPDPGVIELNVQPTDSWDELVDLTETIYEQAKRSRLGCEKFDLDGRHTGTGGGAHVVLGGRSPADSPFVRRPDLLGSLIRFWHNHPALSYLFSGKFIGPTSQAPRMDEARRDAVYEMEIALRQLDRIGDPAQPWVVDRLFRDLLVDVGGNTHRAEICIDKLYSPDSTTGRLGLVELRGFEMPPSLRMNLAAQLLIRAAIAKFSVTPYRAPLTSWGGALHDRFMLPHYVAGDFESVLSELSGDGVKLRREWFAAHHEFRFPIVGQARCGDVTLTIRDAIEPWYVMGEDPAAGGTARYVDSSLERIEIAVEQFDHSRHVVLCNATVVPMHPTGVAGAAVAGVKYRAWQPPRCLHPTIGIHAPLQIDVIDRLTGYSLGGCRYHSVHPGGRYHGAFPVNASEAESRRAARFEAGVMTPGQVQLPPPGPMTRPTEYAVTLDLRLSSA